MCVPPTLRFYGVGGFVLLAEITAAAIPLWGCCSLFCLLFPKLSSPFNFGDGNGRLPTAVSPNIPEAGV